ncbi:fumarylacetoacetate hydrolase family protein [Sulfitobacter pseudonitzschiae]|uniref:Fumarylacetoacetate hydrolase family protein n=1 Tax=Pseudosulfitobacter pseudonitzschiae TaxID=1402135 RepID=A0A9Q2NN10_9RHOB|nr:fumarylacetoacetate hydrolase family protein [Pseudosulfitobacter pseudonitzschiae]MBM2293112.1 fumarylacetoacetate hydrolase family protein [Pseudosulfitobacter pseudonitzschiae]MBM2297799.1 fumarylacetoacetate hydrolase family protein [Pseudosulfitobacter pseudonitzschiae]MBM2302713.1 fumarylacetoacetate hydrolase family protein [Pseudosulfitobacter pseudonitzschiae]MBM2312621.1 fumarylacetoacetate hydrolase family protein [Pseudosulfitobacter pseudonitzschiae]MBM2317409.1 fumarylacetoace
MNFATYTAEGQQFYGVDTGTGMIALSPYFPDWPTLREVIAADALHQLALKAQDLAVSHTDFSYDFPVPNPEKIICVGVNFPDRNAEYKDGQNAPPNMSLFPRFARSFTGHNGTVIRPPETPQLDYEGEIAIVIGKGGRRIAEADAYNHIAALTLCNEGTLRDWVRHAKFNVTQGKNWDNSGAMGPHLVPFTSAAQLDDVELTCHVNGELRQQDRTSRMLFPIRRQIAYISTFTTLVPGDIIVTGTPTGAGARFDPPRFLVPGDTVTVAAEGIGTLSCMVADE